MHPSPNAPGILDWACVGVIWSALLTYLFFQVRYYFSPRPSRNQDPKP